MKFIYRVFGDLGISRFSVPFGSVLARLLHGCCTPLAMQSLDVWGRMVRSKDFPCCLSLTQQAHPRVTYGVPGLFVTSLLMPMWSHSSPGYLDRAGRPSSLRNSTGLRYSTNCDGFLRTKSGIGNRCTGYRLLFWWVVIVPWRAP